MLNVQVIIFVWNDGANYVCISFTAGASFAKHSQPVGGYIMNTIEETSISIHEGMMITLISRSLIQN